LLLTGVHIQGSVQKRLEQVWEQVPADSRFFFMTQLLVEVAEGHCSNMV